MIAKIIDSVLALVSMLYSSTNLKYDCYSEVTHVDDKDIYVDGKLYVSLPYGAEVVLGRLGPYRREESAAYWGSSMPVEHGESFMEMVVMKCLRSGMSRDEYIATLHGMALADVAMDSMSKALDDAYAEEEDRSSNARKYRVLTIGSDDDIIDF